MASPSMSNPNLAIGLSPGNRKPTIGTPVYAPGTAGTNLALQIRSQKGWGR